MIALLALACSQSTPPPPPHAPLAVVTPGTWNAADFPLLHGQEVLAICGKRLERQKLQIESKGDAVVPSVSCNWQVLFGGIEKRVGDGPIVVGTVDGDRSMAPPVTVKVGFADARIHGRADSDKRYSVVVRASDRFVLAEVENEPEVGPTLVWAGDLDNDHAVDWVIDTPARRNASHLRLYLTAKQPDGRPEEVAASRLTRKP